MAISSMIVQPMNGSASAVSKALADMDGVTVHSVTLKQEIIIVLEATSLKQVNEAARTIEVIPGVLGVFPTYITTADEKEAMIS